MVSWIDDRIGDLLATLKATGLDDDTIIIFTSDHGEMLGERGMWFKMSMYEWAVRVPLMVCWPGRLAPRRVAANVSLADLLPTLLDLCTDAATTAPVAVEPLDGRSLRRLLEAGEDPAWPDLAIADFTAGGVPGPLRMVRHGDWKLIRLGGHAPMLFNLAQDRDELVDRVDDPAARGALEALLAIAPDGYDADIVQRQVLSSQRRRLLIRDVDSAWETPQRWNWKVRPDDDRRFVRGGGLQHGEHATKARARFPPPT